jgi:sensor c-di-GMP phosphodiesterase-like protein
VLYPKRTSLKLIAAVLGILATGVPMVLFNVWLKRQGDDEASVTAAWAVAAAERQIGQTVALLQDLNARGLDTCLPAHLEAMRQLVFVSGLIKEVSLIGPSGQVLCTDTGSPFGRRDIVSSTVTPQADLMLDVVRVTDLGDNFLRIRQIGKSDKPSLAALVPAMALLPQAWLHSGRTLSYARMTLPNGTLIGSSGIASEAEFGQAGLPVHFERSARYGFNFAVMVDRDGVIARYDDLRRIGMVVTGIIALVILTFALLFPWRHRDNPVADIAKAIMADEFVPYYQPVVDIQTGRLLGAEVLVRWRRPDGTMVEPGAFIPLMETSGLIVDLTRSLMRTVRKDMGPDFGRRDSLSLAFNVAPQHFEDALILNDVGSIFDGSPIKLSQIVLEMTERYEVENLTATRRVVAALQGLGCRVAIDDVGTGHSGLSYILKLGVDIIKIDKIFVEAIGTERHSKAIIETMIDLARSMRMEIIAEGVETYDQVTYLREHGIRSAQGYVFAPPLPAPAFLQLVEAMDPVAGAAAEDPAAPAVSLAEARRKRTAA